MGFDSLCNTGLVLGLGLNSSSSAIETTHASNKKPCLSLDRLAKGNHEPSLTLGLSGDDNSLYRQDSISTGGASSFSNISVKREREVVSEESERVSNNNNYNYSRVISSSTTADDGEDDDGTVNGRKKLRLTKAQSALLEESFKLHSTLNPKQKQELARELNLRPRQVEVWFQNRRARTKLKQTEVDCEYLKKCCETLTEENRRLHKELQELKAAHPPPPPALYMQLPAATLSMCPSCERVVGDTNSSKSPFTMAPKPHFFNPFTNINPSAAC